MSEKVTVRESVPFTEHEILKEKYEDLLKEHETLIETLEVLEKKKEREAVVAKDEIKNWEKKCGELQKMLEKLEKDVVYLNSSDGFGVDLDVIELSSESSDDEENQREGSGGGQSNSQNQEKVSFKL